MKISVIIPTYNEAENIGRLVRYLLGHSNNTLQEIIIVDGGSEDETKKMAEEAGAVICLDSKKGRSVQMNKGAEQATGDILYFVHADVIPPPTYLSDILDAVQNGYEIGSYRLKLNSKKLPLRFNSFMTRFNSLICRGGDETLFITKLLFKKLGGYRSEFVIMEEYDLIKRAKKILNFHVLQKSVIASARKYDDNGYLRVNSANLLVFTMFGLGFSQRALITTYKKFIRQPNVKRY